MKLRYAFLSLFAVSAIASPAKADSIYDMDHVFKCSTMATDWNHNPLEPKYDLVDGIYTDSKTSSVPRCTFHGPRGETWHPLFPSHPHDGDQTCRIASSQQDQGNTLSKFETPSECLETNEVANLMSANHPASADPRLGQSASFAARLEMIRNAKKSIRIQYLIFFGDESGWELAEALKAKKAENPNIKIRINVDALSNMANETNQKYRTQAMYFDLMQHGIEINGAGVAWVYMNEYFALKPLDLDKRWHDKIIVVDAETPDTGLAIAGGQNLSNEYFRVGADEQDKPVYEKKIWRDQDVLLRGPIVRDLAKALDNNFDYFAKLKKDNEGVIDPSKNPDTLDKIIAKGKAVGNDIVSRGAGHLNKLDAQMFDWDFLVKHMSDADQKDRPYPYLNPGLTDRQHMWKLIAQVEDDCPKFFMGVDCQGTWDKVPGKPDRFTVHFYPYSDRFALGTPKNPANKEPFMNQKIKAHVERIKAQLDAYAKAGTSLVQKMKELGRFHPADMRWFNNHPRFGETYIMQAYTDAVKRAKREIILSNAYFIPHGDNKVGLAEDFMAELKKAVVERGVHVKLMTNDTDDNDLPLITWNARWYYPEVLAWNDQAKVAKNGKKGHLEFYEWNGVKHHENTNHAKYGVFDDREVIVGSFNLDHRSTGINSETVVAMISPELASEMADQFKRNDVPKAVLVTPGMAADWVKEMMNSAGSRSDEIRKRLQNTKSLTSLVVLTKEMVAAGMSSDDIQKFALTVQASRDIIEYEN